MPQNPFSDPKNGKQAHFDLPDGTRFYFVYVGGGTFDMGGNRLEREKPIHPVEVSPFWMSQTPVTQAQWKAVMDGENPSRFKGDKRPVENVSYKVITEQDGFLFRLNVLAKKLGMSMEFALPSEAQWEYAARGGEAYSPYEYAGSDDLHAVGWYRENSHRETKPVGLKQANALGLYDMSGNVAEWCKDWYSTDYYKQCADYYEQYGKPIPNPVNTAKGGYRVLRGGNWDWINANSCRVAYRRYDAPPDANNDVGFRLVFLP